MSNLHYAIMKPHHINSVVNLISEIFTQAEPLTAFLKVSFDEFTFFAKQVCDSIVNDNLSIVAIDTKEKILGVRLASQYTTNPTLNVSQSMQAINYLLTSLHMGVAIQHPETTLHLKMLGVHASVRNQGIAQQLLNETFQNAKRQGYDYVIVEATNQISQHIFLEKFNFTLLNKINYQTFAFNNQLLLTNFHQENKCLLLGKSL